MAGNISPSDPRRELDLHPLPDEVTRLLNERTAPPRLVAHLILVHEMAAQLVDFLRRRWPALPVDASAVLLGAALHDIGKIPIPEELTWPGHRHEEAGVAYLLQAGIGPDLARFARTHASWSTEPQIRLEDLVVALADTCWKGKRDPALEQRIIDMVAAETGAPLWEVWLMLDDEIENLAADADLRLAWQAQFPLT